MEIACAIPGIVSPCCILVEFINAPVAIRRIRFNFPSFSCLKKYPEKAAPIDLQEKQAVHPMK